MAGITVVMTGDGSNPIQSGKTIGELKDQGLISSEFNYQVGGEIRNDSYEIREGDVLVASPKGVEGG